jgi:hypothetical protein
VARKQVFNFVELVLRPRLAAKGWLQRWAAKLFALGSWVFVFCLFKSGENYHRSGFLGLHTTLVVWFVADSEALPYQAIPNYNKSEYLETSTAPAINYTTCWLQ